MVKIPGLDATTYTSGLLHLFGLISQCAISLIYALNGLLEIVHIMGIDR